MSKKIVIALGGNALGNNLTEQMLAVRNTAQAIVDLVEEGHQVVLSHGNGPQVGMIQNAMAELHRSDPAKYETCPLSVCVAMSQGYIGYDLQNALREELLKRGIHRSVVTLLTQVLVDEEDAAFKNPTKPIGGFMSESEAKELAAQKGWTVKEDSGRGWRRVVASPKPKAIVEIESVRALVEAGQIVIACGGGGIPVVAKDESGLKGAAAVIDKDFASATLATQLDADMLVILTAVERVAVNFGKPEQKWLEHMSVSEAHGYMDEGQFAPGSMLPKVQAAVEFASARPGRQALITLLEKAREGIAGQTGTIVTETN